MTRVFDSAWLSRNALLLVAAGQRGLGEHFP